MHVPLCLCACKPNPQTAFSPRKNHTSRRKCTYFTETALRRHLRALPAEKGVPARVLYTTISLHKAEYAFRAEFANCTVNHRLKSALAPTWPTKRYAQRCENSETCIWTYVFPYISLCPAHVLPMSAYVFPMLSLPPPDLIAIPFYVFPTPPLSCVRSSLTGVVHRERVHEQSWSKVGAEFDMFPHVLP